MKKLIVVIVMLLLVAVTGCSSTTKTSDGYFWETDSEGHFQTNDIARAQKEVPFKIIIPTFLPEEADLDSFFIFGPYESQFFKSTRIIAQYLDKGGAMLLSINEESIESIVMPNPDSVTRYMNGISVIQNNNHYSDEGNVISLIYSWSSNKVTYSLVYYRPDSDEGFKIVESMVMQIEL